MPGKNGNFASAAQRAGYLAEVKDGDIKPKHPVNTKKSHSSAKRDALLRWAGK